MKLRIPLFLKITVPFAVLMVLTVLLSGFLVYQSVLQKWDETLHIEERLEYSAVLLANTISLDTLQTIQTPPDIQSDAYQAASFQLWDIVSVAGATWAGIYYPDEQGFLYYWVDSDQSGVGYPFFYATDNHRATLLDGQVRPVVYEDEFGDYFGYVAPIVDEAGEVLALVEVIVAQKGRILLRQETVSQVVMILMLSTLSVTVLTAVMTWWLYRHPLQKLEHGALRLAQGDFGYQIPHPPNDELGDLAHTFNHLSTQLQQLLQEQIEMERREIARLQEAERILELRVVERTTELAHKNEELLHTQVALEAARDQALAASRAKSAFLANMSHEFRTPLNAIIGYGEMLQEDAQAEGRSELAFDLEKINMAAYHLLSLINYVLDLSKIEAGKMTLNLQSFEVFRFVQNILYTIRPLVEHNHNLLNVSYGPDLGTMVADQTKLRQVILNLLSNAAKFTEEGEVNLDINREQDWFRFTIRDTGIGIPADKQPFLFQEFFQVDSSSTRRHRGTGLGLAISYRFCQLMGGSITAESELGKGSTFTVHLPAKVTESEYNLLGG